MLNSRETIKEALVKNAEKFAHRQKSGFTEATNIHDGTPILCLSIIIFLILFVYIHDSTVNMTAVK